MRDKALWLGCLAYAALFTGLGALKYAVHRNLIDFGIFAQTAASAFGCFCNAIEGSHWAFHFSPILYVAGGAVALAHFPLTLIALQAVAGALVAPPLYALALRRSASTTIARGAALVAWLYPPLAGLVFGDFHENGFAPAAVAWMLYAFDAGFIGWAALAALVTLSIKEDQALFLIAAGALGAWAYRGTPRGRTAGVVAIVAAAVALLFFAVIQPHAALAANAGWQPERFYAWQTGDARNLLGNIGARLGFLVLIFLPLMFLPLRSRFIWLAVLPLAEVLLSRMPTTFTLGTHYAGAWIGYVLVAYAAAIGGLQARTARRAIAACVALCVVEFAVANPLHPRLNLRLVEARDVALDRFLARFPAGANVATQEEAYTHLALRDPTVTLLPELPQTPARACLILVDRAFPESARLREYGAALAALVRSRRYAPVTQQGTITLYSSCASASAARAGQP
ncbi:MAG: DUF2079 domain-containing protein [Candidatus Eremiobacteraeota bacterium]|nr:DUF2079 domain-containing protein [Candidatus Eremiobacteraeota bacterium]